ncbi:hypothetical protein GRAN_1292 [Granulicella sibirica]|uniref:Uncharacterized protein n=1 Tax=Granulicella sibirica TaxID=2479048 RepID=A0A4Q0T4T8_9BACT|nr:hypothetical protein GRAN_1292 [Granulicella sibirica]
MEHVDELVALLLDYTLKPGAFNGFESPDLAFEVVDPAVKLLFGVFLNFHGGETIDTL